MERQVVVVLDVGTTKVHANLIELSNGTLIDGSEVSYPWIQKNERMTEIHSADIWEAMQSALEKILKTAGFFRKTSGNIRLVGLSFSWFGANLVTMDASGEEVFPLIVSFDSRAEKEAEELRQRISTERGMQIGRGGLTSESIPAKILWLRHNYPEKFQTVRAIGSIAQYVYQKAGFPLCTEKSMAQTLQYRGSDGSFMQDIAEASGLDLKLLDYPNMEGDEVLAYTDTFGRVVLPERIPVLYGGHDCILSQLGSGVLPKGNGILGDVAGTFDLMGFFRMSGEGIFPAEDMINTPMRGVFSYMEGGPSGAMLSQSVKTLWGKCDGAFLSGLFEASYFDGRHGGLWRLPGWQERKKSAGLLWHYSGQQVFESLVEEITFRLKDSYQSLCRKNGAPFQIVRIGGGAAKSENWIQLKADVFGTAFELMENREVSSMGAAVIAAVTLGYYSDYETALTNMVHISKHYEPKQDSIYGQVYWDWKNCVS